MCCELARLKNPSFFRVIELEHVRLDVEGHLLCLAWSKSNFLESLEFLDRTLEIGFLISDVELYDFLALDLAGIGHLD